MGKYLAYPDYKSTGVEWFPDAPAGWGVLSARRVLKQVRDPANPDDEQLAATQKYGVIPQRLFMEYQDQKVVLALAGTGNFKHVEINDFVISLRSFQGGIERCHYEGCVSPAYTVMRRDKAIDPAYFSFLLKSEGFITALQSVTQGIREGKTITYEQFGSISVPFPTMGEQQHIAAFLDHETAKIGRLIAKQERLIELLKEKRQAVISHAVTKGLNPGAPMKDSGVEWLGEVPAHWRIARLRFLVEGGLVNGLFKKKEHFGSGVLLVNVFDVYQDDYLIKEHLLDRVEVTEEEYRAYQVKVGDMFFVRSSLKLEGVGRSSCVMDVSEPLVFECHLVRARPKVGQINPRFMNLFLNSSLAMNRLVSLANFVTMATVDQEKIKSLNISLPSLDEQQKICDFVDHQVQLIDKLIDKTGAAVSLLHEHRTALISAAVIGKIDVRDWQKPNNEPQEAATAASA